MRILFTGGSGKAGRHVVPYLAAQGHRVLNLDLTSLDHPDVRTLITDVTDAGQVFDALTGFAGLDELDRGVPVPGFDAVVHFAAIPRYLLRPETETYRVNTVGMFNVLAAAAKIGIPKVVFASSETTYGICFGAGERLPEYLPVDEDHPVVPEDAYALSKVAGEVTARGLQRRSGIDVYGLRINNVIEPHEYAEFFPGFFAEPARRRRNLFAYIDVRDLGRIVELCLGLDGRGFEIFNAANDDPSVNLSTREIIDRFYPEVPVSRGMGRYETLYDTRKAREVLGFREGHTWRSEVPDPRAK